MSAHGGFAVAAAYFQVVRERDELTWDDVRGMSAKKGVWVSLVCL